MSTQINLAETKSVRAEARLVIDAGETDVLFTLPDAVPGGQKLVLQVSVLGTYVDADKAPADSDISAGTLVKPIGGGGTAKVGG